MPAPSYPAQDEVFGFQVCFLGGTVASREPLSITSPPREHMWIPRGRRSRWNSGTKNLSRRLQFLATQYFSVRFQCRCAKNSSVCVCVYLFVSTYIRKARRMTRSWVSDEREGGREMQVIARERQRVSQMQVLKVGS